MGDLDREIIAHIDALRTDIFKAFQARREHVDGELRRLHQKLEQRTQERDREIKDIYETMRERDQALRKDLEPILLAQAGRREVRRALVGAITLLVAVGGVVIAAAHLALRWFNGQ